MYAREDPTAEFWQPSVQASKHRPPASPADVQAVQERLGVELPSLLGHLYQQQDGGRLVCPLLRDSGSSPMLVADLEPLRAFETMASLAETVDFAFDEEDWTMALEGTKRLVIIARHAFDWMLCLDYRSSKTPSVLVIDTVLEPREVLKLPSFEAFVDALYEE